MVEVDPLGRTGGRFFRLPRARLSRNLIPILPGAPLRAWHVTPSLRSTGRRPTGGRCTAAARGRPQPSRDSFELGRRRGGSRDGVGPRFLRVDDELPDPGITGHPAATQRDGVQPASITQAGQGPAPEGRSVEPFPAPAAGQSS